MNNLTKLHKIQELINCSFTNLPINEREELNDYIKTLIKIEEFTPEYTTIEPI